MVSPPRAKLSLKASCSSSIASIDLSVSSPWCAPNIANSWAELILYRYIYIGRLKNIIVSKKKNHQKISIELQMKERRRKKEEIINTFSPRALFVIILS